MERSARIVFSVLILIAVALLGFRTPALSATPTSQSSVTPTADTTAATVTGATSVTLPTAPVRAPARLAPPPATATAPTTPAVTTKVVNAPTATTKVASGSTSATRTAAINAMYLAVVPAGERAALAGHYTLGYNLAGLSCGTGCTGASGGQARSSFNATFFAESPAYERNMLAHEAAHAYGFLYIDGYGIPSWAGFSGWQGEFSTLDRGFVRTYDAEAWAACVAWKETGFNNRVDQITSVCTPPAAALAMAQIR
jgi:hypothetical protein